MDARFSFLAGCVALCLALGSAHAEAPQARSRSPLPASDALPAAHRLPVGQSDVWLAEAGEGVDRQTTVAVLPSGGFRLVYAHYQKGDVDSSGLRQIFSRDGRSISPPTPLAFGGAVEDGPVFAQGADGSWLYFASSQPDLGELQLWRARATADGFAAPQRLGEVEGLRELSQIPRWVAAGTDMMLTFRGGEAGPQWLRWSGGARPGAPSKLASMRVAYPRVVPMAGRGCFFSYQRPPEGGYMATYYQISRDCKGWSEPVELAPAKPPNRPDVHDAYALPRRDAGVDVYYVYPSFKGQGVKFPVGFDLYRRAVRADGRVGPEQLLTDRSRFNPFAPAAHRMDDGSVLVSFSDILENGKQGVARARLALFRLEGDAPAPE